MHTISTREAERVLLTFAGVIETRASSFLERLKQLRRFGVPSGVPKGRGVRTGRTIEQMLELALAIRLLEAGLASIDVARLVRNEWVLASSVLGFLQGENPTGEAKPKADVYWVAEPRGLAAYQDENSDRQPQLATLILWEGEQLNERIEEWIDSRDWTVIVIRAREVVHRLLAAYVDTGVAQLDTLHASLRSLRNSRANALRDLVRLRGAEQPPID